MKGPSLRHYIIERRMKQPEKLKPKQRMPFAPSPGVLEGWSSASIRGSKSDPGSATLTGNKTLETGRNGDATDDRAILGSSVLGNSSAGSIPISSSGSDVGVVTILMGVQRDALWLHSRTEDWLPNISPTPSPSTGNLIFRCCPMMTVPDMLIPGRPMIALYERFKSTTVKTNRSLPGARSSPQL